MLNLYATLCELAGLEVPDGLDSRSLASLLKGAETDWDNEVVSQFHQNHVMIKQDALKYQYYGAEIPEVLFDLKRDPKEAVNVADDADYAQAMQAFRQRLAALGHGPEADPNYRNAGY